VQIFSELLDISLLLDCLPTLLDDEEDLPEEDELLPLLDEELLTLLDDEPFPFALDFGWS
jgi:hypothetical protein